MKRTSSIMLCVRRTLCSDCECANCADYDGLPISDALSLGVHESQSLLWERMVALTPGFCRYLLPKIQATFPEFGQGKTPEVRGQSSHSPLCSNCPFRDNAGRCLHTRIPRAPAQGTVGCTADSHRSAACMYARVQAVHLRARKTLRVQRHQQPDHTHACVCRSCTRRSTRCGSRR